MAQIKQSYSAEDTLDDLNALMYIIKGQIENSVNTVEIVRVLNVNGNTIDVIPVIKDINASREPIDESPIYGVRYIRFQYGSNAIRVAPKENDVGLLLVCKKDISAYDSGMVATKIKYNLTNGIYLGGLCGANSDPTQFIDFENDKITITGTGTIDINATTVNVTATTAKIKATTTTIESTTVNLGGESGVAVARVGDSVNLTTGKIVSGSSKVKAL